MFSDPPMPTQIPNVGASTRIIFKTSEKRLGDSSRQHGPWMGFGSVQGSFGRVVAGLGQAIYINQLPINRPSGHNVTEFWYMVSNTKYLIHGTWILDHGDNTG